MKSEGKGILKVFSGITFVVSAVFFGLGLDKMFNYDNGEYYPYEYHNAYVGGDAYNYIINGNYATGFFVLATMFALLGIGFIALYYMSKMVNGQEKLLALNSTTVDNATRNEQIIADGGWKCSCGRINPHYVSTCVCGKHKIDVLSQADEEKESS